MLKSEAIEQKAFKVYSLSTKDKDMIDKIFDKLHAQDKLSWTSQFTFFDYSVFVVWSTTSSEERKKRVVVNIWELNKIIISNSYSMSLQTKIIIAVTECQYIFVVNAQKYFHQWQMKVADRNKLTVVSHWEQKQFSMMIMRFKNSFSYIQWQIDKILRSHWVYAKVYMNDIVIFSHTLEKHLKHLHVIFSLFKRLRICLTSMKSFLEYSFVFLLEQKIDGFKLTILMKKLVIISSFRFSQFLKKLEMYIELIEYLRNYVSYYAQMTESLQKRKTALSKEVSKDLNNARKTKTSRISLVNSIKKKLNVFQLLQKQFRKLSVLTHYNSNLSLYVNLNMFKVYDFNAIVYHICHDSSLVRLSLLALSDLFSLRHLD